MSEPDITGGTRQYQIELIVRAVVTVDESKTSLEAVMKQAECKLEPDCTEWDADIPSVEIKSWTRVGEPKTDTLVL